MNKALLELLKKHDWTYEYSDDHSAWRLGNAQRSAIFDKMETFADKALVLSYANKVPESHRESFIKQVEEKEISFG